MRTIGYALTLTLIAATPSTTPTADSFRALRAIDLRLATIGYRLTTANAALCRDLVANPGMAIHALGQYGRDARATARTVFRFDAPVAVEAVVAGGPADRAGITADESIVTVNGRKLDGDVGDAASAEARDAAAALIARQPATAPIRFGLLRGGVLQSVSVTPVAACPSAFEVLLGPKMEADADGHLVQIGVRFFERYPDDQVAEIVAHELSHNILRHRARLEAAGVKGGLFAELGRDGRLTRKIEDQADALSVVLLRNAGYDPAAAVRFWKAHGGDIDGGIFRSRTHAASSARAKAMAAAIAAIPADAPRPYLPLILAERDMPLR